MADVLTNNAPDYTKLRRAVIDAGERPLEDPVDNAEFFTQEDKRSLVGGSDRGGMIVVDWVRVRRRRSWSNTINDGVRPPCREDLPLPAEAGRGLPSERRHPSDAPLITSDPARS
jgi:hypothetical protein